MLYRTKTKLDASYSAKPAPEPTSSLASLSNEARTAARTHLASCKLLSPSHPPPSRSRSRGPALRARLGCHMPSPLLCWRVWPD